MPCNWFLFKNVSKRKGQKRRALHWVCFREINLRPKPNYIIRSQKPNQDHRLDWACHEYLIIIWSSSSYHTIRSRHSRTWSTCLNYPRNFKPIWCWGRRINTCRDLCSHGSNSPLSAVISVYQTRMHELKDNKNSLFLVLKKFTQNLSSLNSHT